MGHLEHGQPFAIVAHQFDYRNEISCSIWNCDCDCNDKALMDFPLMGMTKDMGACFEALTKIKKCAFAVEIYLK